MDAPEYLVEVDAYTGSGVETLRYSETGYRTAPGDTPASTFYPAVVSDPGTFERALFGDKKTRGLGQINAGAIELINVDGALDALLGYGFDGRVVRVLRLANVRAAYSTAVVVFRGTVQRLDSDDALSRLRLRVYERRLELDKPVQTNRYGGTTTSGGIAGHLADGNEDMKDQPKPFACGACLNVSPTCVNQFDLIYQVNDGAVSAIAVYDGRAALTLKGDYATVALLQAATIPPGKYGTCLAEGLFRLGVANWFTLTADVTQGATLADRNTSKAVERVLAKMGFTGSDNIDATSFSDFATLCPQEVGIYLDRDQRGSDVIGQLLASVGGYIVPSLTGSYQVGRGPDLGTPTWTIDDTVADAFSIVANPDTDQGLPAWRVILRYARNWTVETGEMLCPGISAALKSFAESACREIKVDDTAVKTKFLLAPELTIETLLTDAGDAGDEADRCAGLYGVERDTLTIPVALSDADDMVLGSTGTLILDRFGWDAGKDFTIIDREDRLADGRAILTVWG